MQKVHKVLWVSLIVLCYFIAFLDAGLCLLIIRSMHGPRNEVALLIVTLPGILFLYLGAAASYKPFGRERAGRLMKGSLWAMFAFYLLLLLALTEFDRLFIVNFQFMYQHHAYMFQEYLKYSLNIIPFRTIALYISSIFTHAYPAEVIVKNLLGNLCAFMPFSFFLPTLFKRVNNWKRFMLCVTGIAVAVELLQLALMLGSCDIDDVILNAGGAWLMYALLTRPAVRNIIVKITFQKTQDGCSQQPAVNNRLA